MPSPTVVILLSDKRSGSTIFQTEFLSHPAVSGLDYTSHTYLESHHWLKAAVMKRMPARYFARHEFYKGYGKPRNARTYMIDTICGNLPDFVPPRDDDALIRDGWEALCHRFAAPVFFEKSPQVLAHWGALSMLLEWIEKTDFTVKLVGLVRNPLAVQHSSARLFGTAPLQRQHGWGEVHRNLLALRQMLPEDRLMILRHEDILADAPARFADVCRFAGLEPDPQMGSQVTDRTQNRWRDDPEFGLQLDPAVAQVAKALGYTEAELYNPSPPNTGTSANRASVKRQFILRYVNPFRYRVLRPMRMRRAQAHLHRQEP